MADSPLLDEKAGRTDEAEHNGEADGTEHRHRRKYGSTNDHSRRHHRHHHRSKAHNDEQAGAGTGAGVGDVAVKVVGAQDGAGVAEAVTVTSPREDKHRRKHRHHHRHHRSNRDRDATSPSRRRRRRRRGPSSKPEAVLSVEPAKPKPTKNIWYMLGMWRVLIGASLVALVSGTPNAFDATVADMHTMGTTGGYISSLAAIGTAGLFISLPAGMLADRYGTAVTTLAGALSVCSGYLVFSVAKSKMFLCLAYVFVGIGSGSTFLAALQTAISVGNPLGIGLVSLCMSMSITATVKIQQLYNKHLCSDPPAGVKPGDKYDHCWRPFLRFLTLIIAIGCLVGGLLLIGARTYYASVDQGSDDPKEARSRARSFDEALTMRKSLRIFKKPFFWSLFLSNMVGLGSGVYLVTAFGPIWTPYVGGQPQPMTIPTIILLFSLVNAASNVISPVIAGFLSSRGFMRINVFIAWTLLLQASFFFILGAMDINQHDENKSTANRFLYAMFIAFGGIGYGVFLTMYPMVLGDAYGHTNFGSFLSFMQFGAAGFSLVIPPMATAITNAAKHYWYPSHFVQAGLLTLGAVAMFFPKPPSDSFGTVPPPPGGFFAAVFPCCCRRKSRAGADDSSHMLLDTSDSEAEDVEAGDSGIVAPLTRGALTSNGSQHSNVSDDTNSFTPHQV